MRSKTKSNKKSKKSKKLKQKRPPGALKRALLDYILIAVGTACFAVAVNVFFEPNGLVTGGVSGLGIIIRAFSPGLIGFEIPLWVTNIVFNLPLFVIAAKVIGFKFIRRTIFATIVLSLTLWLAAEFIPPQISVDLLLATVYGGALTGVGLGFVFRLNATTGGSDLAASILHRVIRHIPMTTLLFGIDAVVVTLGFFVFGPTAAMYAIISVFISSKIAGTILAGLGFAKAAFIISDEEEAISAAVLQRLSRGVTGLSGTGMYTGVDKRVLFCVVAVKQVAGLTALVKEIDPKAFIIVSDAREVLGEGFLESPL